MSSLLIRIATDEDFATGVWPIFEAIVREGKTYAIDVDATAEQAYQLWMKKPRQTFVAEEDGLILGTYYIKTNHDGNANHVCNCGYMVAASARGKGVASTMCQHSLEQAVKLGYLAMQYNCVVETNEGAIRLWHKFGFETVGRLPKVFRHPEKGYVDALVMYKWLVKEEEEQK